MPHELHIVQQQVKPENAHSAIAAKTGIRHYAGMNLARIRESRGLTQRHLAEMIGMDASTVNRAEKGASSAKLSTFKKCAAALGVTLSDIFSDPLTDVERAILATFRTVPAENHDLVLRLFELARSGSFPVTAETQQADPASATEVHK